MISSFHIMRFHSELHATMASSSPTPKALSLVFLLSLFHLCIFFSVAVDAGTDDAQGALNDMRALIEFKKCITSDPLSVLNDWHYDATAAGASNACNWTGISCSSKHPGRIVGISLQNATLRGSLSPHLSNLSFLQVLDFNKNTFSGTIPASLGTLHRLKYLDFCSNKFEGGIPHQFGNISSLQFLYLCVNSFSGEIPESLARLQALQVLNVAKNQVKGQVPSWLGALHKLEKLELGRNKFHGVIPVELGNLSSSLTFLSLASNNVRGFIPCSVASLHRLTELYLQQNNITGTIPACLHNLTTLISLDIDSNNLEGDLPTWIGSSFSNLKHLSLFTNRFTGNIPHSWRNLTHLHLLDLSNNRLSGTPPSWLGTLCTQLRHFSIAINYYSSGVRKPWQPIPILNTLSNCSLLTDLFIDENHLTGTFPTNFGSSLPSLQNLYLSKNLISGNIPPSIGNLSSLVILRLGKNALSATIPPEIANLRSLQVISLSRNKLQGNIPSEISLLNNSLACLYLSGNRLSGSIPASITKLVSLRKLYLGRNLLSGKIPSEMGNCAVLEDLVLSANNFSGPIPAEVAGLGSIVLNFDLSANGFTGEVPPEIAGLQMARYINLSSNQLSGNIASYMECWFNARQINLSLNNFGGNLSKSIGEMLTQLQSIDLSGNNFTGPVPASLFSDSNLHFLNFSYNNFDQVPCERRSATKLLRLTRRSFLGNPNLCGRCFGLRSCQISPEQRKSHSHKSHSHKSHSHKSHSHRNSILKIVFGIVCGLSFLCVTGILLYLRRMDTNKGEIPRISDKFLKISAEEIQRATDNFSALNLVGEGSHGKVYRGLLTSGIVVAIKCFSSTHHGQQGTVKTFKKECQALGKVRHRNILKIITVVWSQNLKALVMPFMSNGSLHSLLYSREDGQLIPLNLPVRVKIITELAMGLHYLHHDCDFQIIHCDIKPENVLLDDDLTVKISDFGLSCLIGDIDGPWVGDFDGPSVSSSEALKGSVGYVAPEYGMGGEISVKGDVYSFGVVTLEVITRLKPTHDMFSGDLTLPLWISMALEGKSGEEKRQMLRSIVRTADEGGGGIEMDKDEEMSVVESILKVGLRCACPNASMRPSMKEVESFLQSMGPVISQDQRVIPRNLEEAIISIVESQPPLYGRRAQAQSQTFSSSY